MVLIFDLDDTLYEERTYVQSGFRAVARWLETKFAWEAEASYQSMWKTLEAEGRGRVFDTLLEQRGKPGIGLIRACVRVYRGHPPGIRLWPAAAGLRHLFPGSYLVSDGHKGVQARKLRALGLAGEFKRAYLTHRFGIQHAKPSTYCFERIREKERCRWEQMVYIADDPSKDFVNLTPRGVHTVRVLTGAYRRTAPRPGYEARYRIRDLTELWPLLRRISS